MKAKNALKAVLALAFAFVMVAALAGCGGQSAEESTSASESGSSAATSEDKTIVVGASPSPHAEILAAAEDVLAEEGWTLEIVEYSDYIQPNVALESGDLDANYFQHNQYLENYNAENGTDLVNAGNIHFEPMTLYAGKTASVDELPDGAQIAVPSDASNEARALLVLQEQGIITLAEGAGLEATPNDIVDNPKNVQIVEAEAAALPRMLEDADMAVINGNYALSSGLDQSLVVATEQNPEAESTYPNVIAVRAGDENSEKTQALVKALTSDTVRQYIEETYGDAVVACF
ncbi:MAG TPA: MetQ/NlpA family ABC transporter substrate-binding protein [Candidatus Aveggerthella stercoripullorum]|uniref:Lipoprotein n=1 Tax=Candidatus Aveggerthella stercoripullorum TaxID=2840688 RepID=A0A9D1A1F7_9ACTN|nr:MetQ/NlpA family ABC transporter substrate-binding protein [Slackia piriformis]HIR02317.1 MetQ/NlpA family ABC transporter substrate-binding protein [Candidatus Aveggerthella stercoripullorum]